MGVRYVQPVFFTAVSKLAQAGVRPFHRLGAARLSALVRPIELARVGAEANRLAHELGDPQLGVTVADRLPRGALGLLEFLAASAPTWLQSMERAVRFGALANPHLVFEVRRRRNFVDFVERLPSRYEVMGRHINEFSVVTFMRLMRQALGPVTLLDAAVAHAETTSASSLERLLGRAPRFGAGENRLRISATDAARAPALADDALFQFLEAQAAHALPTSVVRSTTHVVEDALRSGLLDGRFGIEDIAASLHLSRRTLQRRLATENTTFEAVLDGLRRRLAAEAEARGASPSEMSFMLGYSDPRAFHRAMKRWKQRSTPSRSTDT
jgi:AraC-like DNA-binding protein